MRKKINEADKAYIKSNPYKSAQEISADIDLSLDIVEKYMTKIRTGGDQEQKVYTLDHAKAQQNDDATKKHQNQAQLNQTESFIWRNNG